MLNFVMVSFLIFLFLGVIWSTNGWMNVFLKMLFVGMTFCAAFLTLQGFGFIVQI